ncbi:hypothetical protein HPP92_011714 [Vanilla planifolia]|uniref:Uncharacterized protein n=1 Tax=Vanilla planifolia TaxID=51239 RepID=A0A835R903_VANPL|nr:hypothetical protein HPP92_011714 [Vanilla planifolia]
MRGISIGLRPCQIHTLADRWPKLLTALRLLRETIPSLTVCKPKASPEPFHFFQRSPLSINLFGSSTGKIPP